MKAFTKITALVLSAGLAATLAGCAGCAGCSNQKNTTLTLSNWYTGTSYSGIQPSFIDNPEFSENLVYDVSFDAASASNATYAVDYSEGSYRTSFYATSFDWNSDKTADKSGYRAENATETVYCYTTELKISVKFSMKTGDKAESEVFNNSVVTECYFRAASKALKPVYSRQRIISYTPASYNPAGLDTAYVAVDVEYQNFYNIDCTEVTSVKLTEGNREEKVYPLNKLKNSLFDNSSLYIAMRSMKLNSGFTKNIDLFSPAAGGAQTYTLSATDADIGAETLASVTAALAEKQLFVYNNPDSRVATVAVNVNYSGGDLQGVTQTAWYAAITDPDNNVARSTLLKVRVPLSYRLGTLNYTLNKVESTLWND